MNSFIRIMAGSLSCPMEIETETHRDTRQLGPSLGSSSGIVLHRFQLLDVLPRSVIVVRHTFCAKWTLHGS